VEGKRGFGCSAWREGCEYVLWKDYEGHAITDRQVRELLQRRISMRPVRIHDTQSVLALTDQGAVTHVAVPMREHQTGKPESSQGPRGKTRPKTRSRKAAAKKAPAKQAPAKKPAPATCPLCSHPMVERDTAYCCAAWRAGCRFEIHKTIAGKKISKAMARSLLTKGQTRVLKGFTSRSDKPFEARLKLEEGRVRFEFE